MIQFSRRQIILIAIALITLVVVTLAIAPSSGGLQQRGSTYSRAPDGYGAWYAFMEKRKTPIQRWQKSTYPNHIEHKNTPSNAPPTTGNSAPTHHPITLLKISPQLSFQYPDEEWVTDGNVLILLGIQAPATSAPFTTDLNSSFGTIRIETSRRHRPENDEPTRPEATVLLGDSFGVAVWEEKIGNGRIIYAAAPYLAANAYQDFRPNYEFLAKLVTQPGYPIWVDEYLHGYKDPITNTEKIASEETLFFYLLKTPLSLLVVQIIVILGVLIWGQNRRLGPPEAIATPTPDNSTAYIQAMASVLNKAGCSEFVLETVGKAEQLEVQKALGLGTIPLPLDELSVTWSMQTGHPAEALKTALQIATRHTRISEADLHHWINEIQKIRETGRKA